LIHIKADRCRQHHDDFRKEEAMPITDALILSGIVAAFVGFGLILAWGEYQTRHIRTTTRLSVAKTDSDRSPTKPTVVKTVNDLAA
jgi:hypothetical protein